MSEALTSPTVTNTMSLSALAPGSTSGDVLKWNTTTWIAQQPDVIKTPDVTAPASGELVRWGGTGSIKFSSIFLTDSGNFTNSSGAKLISPFDSLTYFNCSLGLDALKNITSGGGAANTAVGFQSMYTATTASYNASFGANSMQVILDGSFNTAFGFAALFRATSGNNNAGFGSSSLVHLTTGTDNTAVGRLSGSILSTGSFNTIIGSTTTLGASDSGCILIGANATSTGSGQLVIKSQTAGDIIGTVTLVAGSATVSTVSIAADTQVFLSRRTTGGTVGHLYISAINPGVSFNITSTSGADTSTVSYLMVRNG